MVASIIWGTAYSLEPATLRWEVLVKGVRATK
jgi:hypothetical protein